jgi:hypothetical protein
MNYHNHNNKNNKVNRCDTLRLSKEFNEKHLNKIILKIDDYSIMKDDIVNFRPLTNEQMSQLESFTEIQKIELIKLYNKMFITLEDVTV